MPASHVTIYRQRVHGFPCACFQRGKHPGCKVTCRPSGSLARNTSDPWAAMPSNAPRVSALHTPESSMCDMNGCTFLSRSFPPPFCMLSLHAYNARSSSLSAPTSSHSPLCYTHIQRISLYPFAAAPLPFTDNTIPTLQPSIPPPRTLFSLQLCLERPPSPPPAVSQPSPPPHLAGWAPSLGEEGRVAPNGHGRRKGLKGAPLKGQASRKGGVIFDSHIEKVEKGQ